MIRERAKTAVINGKTERIFCVALTIISPLEGK